MGQPVIVENRPGANGGVAAECVLVAAADGYTFLVTDGSMFSINPFIYSKLTYDPCSDFIAGRARRARAAVPRGASEGAGQRRCRSSWRYAKAQAGQLNYGSSGIGSTHHLTMEALKRDLGLDLVHVPYKGTGPVGARADRRAGRGAVLRLSVARPASSRTGRVKLIASNGAQRSAQAPDVPTIAETIPGFDFAPIIGVLAPVGTPPS